MSGLSQLQRRILRLALAVNAYTQGGTPRVKTGATVPGYRVPTVGYYGPKDLRPPMVLWAIGGLQPSDRVPGFFAHDAHSRSVKAGIVRAMTRLMSRGLIVYAPTRSDYKAWEDFPDWGYVLTAEGLAAAGTEPLEVPMMEQACMLFGVTHNAFYGTPMPWAESWIGERSRRKIELIELLRSVAEAPGGHPDNGYQDGVVTPVAVTTDGATATGVQICTPVTVDREHGATATEGRATAPAVTVAADGDATATGFPSGKSGNRWDDADRDAQRLPKSNDATAVAVVWELAP
jgi:hypothetical protein